MDDVKTVVADTNVIMDAGKERGAPDVADEELEAAWKILEHVIEGDLCIAYSRSILNEWRAKGLFNQEDSVLRMLIDMERLVAVEPMRVRRAAQNALGCHVDHDDQCFVFAAAALVERVKLLVTRDPRTLRPKARRFVKKNYSVIVAMASEFVARRSAT